MKIFSWGRNNLGIIFILFFSFVFILLLSITGASIFQTINLTSFNEGTYSNVFYDSDSSLVKLNATYSAGN